MQLSPGTIIERYVVERLLGEGGMAEVYCVRHAGLGSRHALKVLTRPSSYLASRLLKEGRVQGGLQHPHLLPVREILAIDGRPALLMPLVQGPTLAALLRIYRPPPDEALALLRCVLEGLAFAHQRGVIHRDLKPANVLLEVRHGLVCPLIADFGLVKVEEEGGDRTRDGAAMGTPAYAAPEQLRDAGRVTPRADLFSLGVLLVEVLTGARPFAGEGVAETLDARRLPPRLEGLDGALRDLAADLLRSDPAQRPASCEDVLARLPDPPLAARASPALVNAVQQAAAPPGREARATLPTASAAESPRHNLAPLRDRFVGRQREIQEIRHQLAAGARLVTLLGAGGIGKTRLAAELGWASLAEWPGGVWLCELAEARTPEGAAAAAAAALDVPLGPDPEAQIAAALAGRGEALFILDNFEQLAPLAARTLGRWLDRAPAARFLVTSRERLRLRGERVVTLDVLEERDAAALFAERARQVNDRLVIGPKDEPAVRSLVSLLDRLPLAIELAAARSRLLSLPDLLARMAQRFELLASASAELPSRQRTLRAALEWSWDLLNPAERSALAQCSAFEGGFTLAAAEAVIAAEGDLWLEEILAELVDKSLLVSREGRLTLLASVQEFARERLADAAAVEARHGRFFAQMGAEAAVEALHRSGGTARGWALWAERDNLAAAARRGVARGDPALAAGCALAAAEVFEVRGPLPEGLALLAAAQQVEGLTDLLRARLAHKEGVLLRIAGRPALADPALRAALDLDSRAGGRLQGRILLDSGGMLREQGRMDQAAERYQQALAIARGSGDRRLEGHALLHCGLLHAEQGRMDQAEERYRQALAVLREIGDRKFEGKVLGNLANLHRERGQADESLGEHQRALAIFHEVGDRRAEAISLGNLSGLHRDAGRLDAALRCGEQSLALSREIGDRRFEALALVHLGNALLPLDRLAEAAERFEQALAALRDIGDRLFEGVVLNNLGALFRMQGRADLAARRLEQAIDLFREVGNRRLEAASLGLLGGLQGEAGDPARGRTALIAAEAILREAGDPLQLGVLLCRRSALESQDGRAPEARKSLAEAQEIAAALGSEPGSELGRSVREVEAMLEGTETG